MKTIDYERSFGSFKIQYLDDLDIVEGTINVDDNSLKTDLADYIINNDEGTEFSYNTNKADLESVVHIRLLEKDIILRFKEVSEDCYYERFIPQKESRFKNIKYENKLSSINFYFQFYYKPSEWKEYGTISHKIINGLKQYSKSSCYQNDYYEDYSFFKKIFIKNFLKKYNLIDYDIICSVPSHVASNINCNAIALMIQDICKIYPYIDGSQILLRYKNIPEQKKQSFRLETVHLNSIRVNSNVRGKNIILLDDIMTSGSSLNACKKLLLKSGANSVLCFAFGKR